MMTGNDKTHKACQQCRALKVKCVRVPAELKCMKCTKSGADCVAVPTTRSVKASRPKRLRLVDLDSKLTGILNQLGQSIPSADNNASTSVASLEDNLENPNTTNADPGTINPTEIYGPPSATTASRIYSIDTLPWSLGIDMSIELLDHLLTQFRNRQSYFPFVVIPFDWTVQSMLNDRPFLLLSAITSVTGEYPSMQDTLAREFRETLSRRVVVAGENNLDLLQGLNVHLAWYQHHMIPRSQLAYRTIHLAISMLVDLGLDRDFDNDAMQRNESQMRGKVDEIHNAPSDSTVREWHRAALGCYYLSSVISASIQRPNRLPFSNTSFKRAAVLSDDPEVTTDRTIQPLIRLQRIIERVRDLYGTDSQRDIHPRLHTHAEKLIADLDEWRYSLPSGMYNSDLFANRYHSTRIWIYEMGLVYHFNIRRNAVGQKNDTSSLVANLLECVDAVKDYIDSFFAMPIHTYQHLPVEEWFRFIMAFFALYKLSAGMPELPFWDTTLARQTIDLDKYLDIAIDRIRKSRGEETSSEVSSGDVYSVLPEILESARASYILVRDHPENAGHGLRAHVDVGSLSHSPFSTNNTVGQMGPSVPRGCPATGYWRRQAMRTDDMNGTKGSGEPQYSVGNDMWNFILEPEESITI